MDLAPEAVRLRARAHPAAATQDDLPREPHAAESRRPASIRGVPSRLVNSRDGGTGSFGRQLVRIVLQERSPRRMVVFSRDELKQSEFARNWAVIRGCASSSATCGTNRVSWRAPDGVDYVVHAAALKQVPAAEYNPLEAVKTNILGAENLINAALDRVVQRIVALSTDKASSPINGMPSSNEFSRAASRRAVSRANASGSVHPESATPRANTYASRAGSIPAANARPSRPRPSTNTQ